MFWVYKNYNKIKNKVDGEKFSLLWLNMKMKGDKMNIELRWSDYEDH